MRSWTAEVTAFEVVVRIEQDLIHCGLGSLLPQPCEREQLPVFDLKAVGLFLKGVCRDMHLRLANASRNAGSVAAVSDLALIIWAEPDVSFAHEGMRPQRTSDSSRRGSFGC